MFEKNDNKIRDIGIKYLRLGLSKLIKLNNLEVRLTLYSHINNIFNNFYFC